MRIRWRHWLCFVFVFAAYPLFGQSRIKIRLISGAGKPFHGHVRVWWDGDASQRNIESTQDGIILLDIPSGALRLHVAPGAKEKEPYRIGYLPCTDIPLEGYDVEIIIKKGVSTANTCESKHEVSAKPGEIVFYESTLHWWQDFQ